MRFDKVIFLVEKGTSKFDYETGNTKVDDPIKKKFYASISDTGTERMSLLYGGVRQNALTVTLKNINLQNIDYIEIDGKKYNIDNLTVGRNKKVLEVSSS